MVTHHNKVVIDTEYLPYCQECSLKYIKTKLGYMCPDKLTSEILKCNSLVIPEERFTFVKTLSDSYIEKSIRASN
jgi:hypothetical protein